MRSLRTLQIVVPEMFLRALVGKQVWCEAVWLCAGFKHSCYASDADVLCRKIIQTQFMTESVNVAWQWVTDAVFPASRSFFFFFSLNRIHPWSFSQIRDDKPFQMEHINWLCSTKLWYVHTLDQQSCDVTWHFIKWAL